MIVVGGLYEERCAIPWDRRLRGSGLRAAASLSGVADDVHLLSAIEADVRAVAETVANGLGVPLQLVERSERVRFNYFTPLSAPLIDGSMSCVEGQIGGEDDVALVFGMVEAPLSAITVNARRLIVDPQQPRDLLELDLKGLEFEELAIVANVTETVALGGDPDVRTSARALLKRYRADVVVTKWGAQGTLITDGAGQDMVGAFPTRVVWPIGTGDVFAAGFAWAWGHEAMAPVDAARFAGRSVAAWTERREEEPPIDPTKHGRYTELEPAEDVVVYLAAPFFDLGQRWFVELVKESTRGLGAGVFSPLHDVGVGGPEVAVKDLAGLEAARSVFAWLDGEDPGTLFEVGYATARGMPVVGYSTTGTTERHNMLVGTGSELHEDLSSAVYRAIWAGMGLLLGEA